MPIDQLIPRQLTPDADSKLVRKTSFLDALNIYSGDYEEGNQGILKNILGNSKVSGSNDLPNDARIIGKVEDIRTGLIYFFVYSETAINHGIWVYDLEGVLPASNPNSINLVYRSNVFNFPQNGLIKGDVVYSNAVRTFSEDLGPDFEKDAIIYFTDGVNEPRKINAYRAYNSTNNSLIHGGSMAVQENLLNEQDFITACTKTPLKQITFQFTSDDSKSTNDFLNTPGFQFAYQYIYIDGMETALSSYSDIAFPPSVLNQGAAVNVDHNQTNRCDLTIPLPGKEVKSIRILGRQGNTGSFLVIDQVDAEGFDGTYAFYNDKVLSGFNSDEVNKQFDSVPRKATAQTTSSNRLFYGNYLDGFDNVEVSANATVIYQPRDGNEFISGNVKVTPSIPTLLELPDEDVSFDDFDNAPKTSGFVVDCSELPAAISEGDIIEFQVTLAPDRNWHVYNFTGSQSSYHQSTQLGPQEQSSPDVNFNEANTQLFFSQTDESAGSTYITNTAVIGGGVGANSENVGPENIGGRLFGSGKGVNDSLCSWEHANGTINNVAFGTSAGNPLILKGAAITFKAKFKCNTDQIFTTGRINVARAITLCLTVVSDDALESPLAEQGFELIERTREPEYQFNLGINSGQIIGQRRLGDPDDSDPLSRLIVAVRGGNTDNEDVNNVLDNPCGAFIVNAATVRFRAEKAPNRFKLSDPEKAHIRFGIESINPVADTPFLFTCIHETPKIDTDIGANSFVNQNPPISDGWIAVGEEEFINGLLPDSFLQSFGFTLADFTDDSAATLYGQTANFVNQVGFLKFNGGDTNQFYNENAIIDGPEVAPEGSTQDYPSSLAFCCFDGEGGPGGGKARGGANSNHPYDTFKLFNSGSLTVNQAIPSLNINNPYRYTAFWNGTIQSPFDPDPDVNDIQRVQTILPLISPVVDTGFGIDSGFEIIDYSSNFPKHFLQPFSGDDLNTLDPKSPNFKRLHSYTEITSAFISSSDVLDPRNRSFKTNANHDFGVVYYDERGRHGFVNPIDPVYVAGYSELDRGAGAQGRAAVSIELLNDPPEWAHYYKIVYAKNTSVKDFIQYSSGGAFTASSDEQEIADSNTNIYVSLNYLQGHPVSYVSSFGARTPEGGLNFYKFEHGDKLRVISYFDGTDREYPANAEFDVVKLVDLGSEQNPLAISDVPENNKGNFVVLKDNPTSGGFRFSDVSAGTDFWGNNCIIELFSPSKEREEDERFYYEISDRFDVGFDADDTLVHTANPVVVTKGDVFFRKVAVNSREFDGNQYQDIIVEDNGFDNPPQSNFKSVFLETNTATDLYRSDSIGIGRPNVILEGAKETVRESTITYSDPSNPESTKVNYSSFNASLANFKDLPEKFNSIQYLGDHGDSIFCLQKDKLSRIPVNRAIVAGAAGGESLIASRNVLNEAIFFTGQSGCDNDPSSVSDIDGTVFFANKSLGTIYKYNKDQGLAVISDEGLSSFFRERFEDAVTKARLQGDQVRVVGGYDPVKKEYLVTIIDDLVVLTTQNPVIVDQPGDAVVAPSDDIFQEDIIVDPEDPPTGDDFQAGFEAGLAAAGLTLDAATPQELVNQLRYVTGFTAEQLNQLRVLASDAVVTDIAGGEEFADGSVGIPDLLAFLSAFNQSYVPEEEFIQPIDPPTPSEGDPDGEGIDEGDGIGEGEDDGEGEENGDGDEDDAGGGAA
tara:strand:+ start:217 stop:5271 length:5055 start_codon:yes stop_codon:yes gene_type:complete